MRRYMSFCFFAAVFLAGCVVSPPPVRMTGEKTLVENQIIGEYREIEEDSWAVSSVKTGVQRQKSSSLAAGDEASFGAMKIRELHEDRIRYYKNEEAAGEANTGYIVYRTAAAYEKDADLKKNLMAVIDEENKARRTLFERSVILAGRDKPSAADVDAVAKKFAAGEKDRAQKNDWVQESNGTWIRKK